MTFRVTSAPLLAVILTACATPISSEDRAQQTKSLEAHINCLRDAAHRIDDGKTDPLTVAIAIMPLCAIALQRAREAFTAGMSPAQRERFERRTASSDVETATSVVMQERARQ